jgi:hypothetical protein
MISNSIPTSLINEDIQKRKYSPTNVQMKKRKTFSDREVGLTHPDLSSFIRLNDYGDIEIFAAPGIGIVISARSKSISLFADSIKFTCKEDGLKWNRYTFNYAASSYSEPTLVKINPKTVHSANNKVSYYLDFAKRMEEEEIQKGVTIQAKYAFGESDIPVQNFDSEGDISDLSFENRALLEAYSTDYSKEHILLMIKFIRDGYSFDQAHQKALREESGSNELSTWDV